MNALLKKLNLAEINSGVCTGPDGWVDAVGPVITSHNPFNNEPIARVQTAAQGDYDHAVRCANESFQGWRMVPPPGAAN